MADPQPVQQLQLLSLLYVCRPCSFHNSGTTTPVTTTLTNFWKHLMYKRPIYQPKQNLLYFNNRVLANDQIQSYPWKVKIHRKNLSPAVAWQLETSLKNIIRETARSSAPLVSVRIFYHEAASHGIDWLLRLSFQDQFTPIIKARRSCRKQFATVYIQFATVYIQDESRRPKTFRA